VSPVATGPVRVEQVGDATLYLGDCLTLIPRLEPIAALVTDPPYSSGGQFRGDRTSRTTDKYQSPQHRGLYPEFSGDNRDQRGYGYWSALWLGAVRERALPGALACVFTDWRQLPTTTDALQAGGWVWRGLVPWDKTEGARPQKGRYRNQAEYVVWGSNGPMADEGPCAPGVYRMPVDVADKHHVAGKPVALLEGLLQLVPRGATVLDPFMGSGTTAVACARLGLRCIGIEIDAANYDVAVQRVRRAARAPALFSSRHDPALEMPAGERA
jgi:site-specific DNA-methyltransferase (adenine-specific)